VKNLKDRINNEDDNNSSNNQNQPPQGPGKFVLIGVIIAIMLLLYFFYSQMQDNHTITYNEFLYYVQGENGRIISDIKKPLIIYDNGKITGIFRRNDNGIDTPFATRIPPIQDNGELYNLLRKNNIVFKVESDQNSFISVFILNILPIALLVFFIFIMFRQFQGAGNKAFSFGKSRAKRFDPKDRITFNEVAGVEEAKVELQEVIEFLKDLQRFTRIGAKIPKGVLLVGPPGTGKTLLARAVAGEAGVPFFYMSGSDFLELFVGIGASRVRGAGYGGGHDEREQTLNQLLVEMDGFDPSHGVILIAATNRPDVLDPALLRPGRFDRQIVVDNPDIKGREEIFKIHTKKVALSKNVDLKKLAKATPGFSGADIANMVNEAALLAARLKKNRVTMAEFEEARDKVLMGVARKSKLIPPKDKKITAYHEAGHTIVNIFTEYSDPIHKVSVIPRGMALGITSTLPENDNYHLSKLRILDDICVLMGGRAAEEIMFGDVCTGAMNDINRATDLARKMVTQWGMSENLGPITYGQKEEPIFIGKEIATHKDYSEKTAQIIDEEIKNVIMSQYKRAKDILIENKDKMIKLADTLFERETLDSEEIYNLLGIKPKDSNGEGDTEKKTEDNE